MKTLYFIIFCLGLLIGLFIGGYWYSNQYMKLDHKYNQSLYLLKYYKKYYDSIKK